MVTEQAPNRTGSSESRGDREPDADGLQIDPERGEEIDPSVFEAHPAVEVDTLFETLSDPGRRYVLTYLLRAEGPVSCSELVDYVVERTDNTMTDEQFRKRVVTSLTHTHLPKLSANGFVDYNVERQLVAPTECTVTMRPYLNLALEQQRRQGARPDEE